MSGRSPDGRLPTGLVADGLPFSAMRRYHVTTFGCQMNAHDSERIKGMLESLGLGEATAPDEADVLVFNTCTIREKPDTRLAAYLGNAGRGSASDRMSSSPSAAATRRRSASGSSSCTRSSTSPSARDRSRTSATGSRAGGFAVDARSLRHARALRRRSPACAASAASRPGCRSRWAATRRARTASSRPSAAASRAGGRARSSPRSRASPTSGVREITLLGQNVNSWGRDLAPDLRTEFGELLRACDAVAGIERIRFTSPHPKDFREPVVAAIAECPSVCEHVHLPAQSGSSRVLKAMRRTYDRDALPAARRDAPRGRSRSRARHRSHRRVPGRDGRRLRGDAVARRGGAVRQRVHVHLLAARGNRSRRRCPTRSPTSVKHERLERLVERVQRIAAERNAERVGRVEEVLVEGPSRTDPALLRGRTRRNTTVNFAGSAPAGRPRRRRSSRTSTSTTLRGREVVARRGLSATRDLHTLGTFVTHTYELPAIRCKRVVGWGAPRDVTESAYEVVAIFGPTASGKSAVARARRRRARHRGRVRRRAPGLPRAADPHEPAGRADAARRDPRPRRRDVRRRVRGARARGDRRARRAHVATAVVAGGTGLYLRAALADLEIPPAVEPRARARARAASTTRDPRRGARAARASSIRPPRRRST